MGRTCTRLVAAALLAGMAAGAARAEDRALVIGIGDYVHSPLGGTVEDALDFRRAAIDALGFRPEQVRVLADEDATRADILRSVEEWLVQGVGPGERAVLYFAGHGVSVPDLDHDEDGDAYDEALVAYDFPGFIDEARSGLVLDDEIRAATKRLADRRFTLVVDSCHSGTIHRGTGKGTARMMRPLAGPEAVRRAQERARRRAERLAAAEAAREAGQGSGQSSGGGAARGLTLALTQPDPRIPEGDFAPAPEGPAAAGVDTGFFEIGSGNALHEVWTASAADQLAFEQVVGDRVRGVFTRAFTGGLTGGRADANGNGRVSRNELLAHVRAEAAAYCAQEEACLTLTPTLTSPARTRRLEIAAWPEEGAPASTPASGGATATGGVVVAKGGGGILLAGTGGAAGNNPQAEGQGQGQGQGAGTGQAGPAPDGEALLDLLARGGVPARLEMLRASGAPGPVRRGDEVRFRIASEAEGQALLFDLSEGGVLRPLFPSARFGKNTRLRSGAPLLLPDAYSRARFRFPGGRGTLVAVVANEPGLVADIARDHADLRPIEDPGAFLAGLMDRLTGLEREGGGGQVRARRYGVATLRYDDR